MIKSCFALRFRCSVPLWLLVSMFMGSVATAQISEPYRSLHHGRYTDAVLPHSPDPTATFHWDAPTAADSLQLYIVTPQKTVGQPASAFRITGSGITVVGSGSLQFDFGEENAGWIEFESDDLPDSVEMSISEYNEPAVVNSGAQHPVKTKAPVKYGHTYRLELNDELYEGVRFGWIHVGSFSRPWHIKNVRLVCQVKPVNYQGSFDCSDTLLTRIWYTGAYVVKLNMLQNFFGAILMERSDRHSWTGDAYPAQAAALAAFGNYDVISKNIAFTSDQDNGIAAYSMYWVLSLIDYFNYTGDTAFLKKYAANADQRLEKAYRQYDQLPHLGFMGWDERLGAGFEDPQSEECRNTYRMLCINAWKQFAQAMRAISNTALAEKYAGYAQSKTDALLADSSIIGSFGVHAISEAVNAGLLSQPAIRQRAQHLYADRLARLSYSPFNQNFIIGAMALAGQQQRALTTIEDNWGGQITYGGTCFFEVYRPSWNAILGRNGAPVNNQCGYTSLAHPWGAGVTRWLSENVLGIRPVAPGFARFDVMPYLGSSLSYVKGTMPTPHGTIAASFNSSTGDCRVSVPAGTIAGRIGIPKTGRRMVRLVVNNTVYRPQANGWSPGSITISEDSAYLYLHDIPSGNYLIRATYAGMATHTAMEAPIRYSIRTFTQDSLTSGNWSSRYGKQGYLLFNSGTPGYRRIPSYIDSVVCSKNGTVRWETNTTDSRALTIPGSRDRIAAAIVTRDPEPTFQTMTIDLPQQARHAYRLTLYWLDWDKKDRRSAIELFDLHTRELIAPVQLVGHYENGRYVSFVVDRPVRIRVNQVRGRNAAVAGLFFDAP